MSVSIIVATTQARESYSIYSKLNLMYCMILYYLVTTLSSGSLPPINIALISVVVVVVVVAMVLAVMLCTVTFMLYQNKGMPISISMIMGNSNSELK